VKCHPQYIVARDGAIIDGGDLDSLAGEALIRYLRPAKLSFLILPTLHSLQGSYFAQPT
jgi:hypothetical protein